MQQDQQLLRIQDVSAILKISVPHLRKQLRTNAIPNLPQPIKLAGVKLWKASQIDSFISDLGVQA